MGAMAVGTNRDLCFASLPELSMDAGIPKAKNPYVTASASIGNVRAGDLGLGILDWENGMGAMAGGAGRRRDESGEEHAATVIALSVATNEAWFGIVAPGAGLYLSGRG